MGWVIAGIVIVLVFDLLVFIGFAATSSAMDAFNQEVDDQEQLNAIREYNWKKAEKKRKKEMRRNKRWHKST